MGKGGFSVSIRFGIGSVILLAVVVTAATIGFVTYGSIQRFIFNDIQKRIAVFVGVAAMQIDGDAHARIATVDDEAGPDYAALRGLLQRIRAKDADLRFVYTMRPAGERAFEFVVDAEEDPDEISHVGDAYEGATPAMCAAVRAPYQVQVEDGFTTDAWGTWLSGFAPVLRSDGSLEAILGVDISVANVLAYQNRYLLLIVVATLAVVVVGGGLGLWVARNISRPLLRLEQEMLRIQRFDLESTDPIRSRISEVSRMGNAVANMKSGLRSFKKYVPSEVVGQLITLGKEASLEVERRDVTVFFSDIAGFTGITEAIEPGQMVSLLDDYFTGISSAIMAEQGTIDKFIGDAVMAFWNAPAQMEDHAGRACRAALACRNYLREMFEAWKEAGLPALETRFGIHTGDAIVGNIGYEERMNYTAMGDTVNTASRLEGLNKYYNSTIIISEQTKQAVQGRFALRPLDRVAVKGRKQGLWVYELLDEQDALDDGALAALDAWNQAHELYQKRNWAFAAAAFEHCAAANPADQTAPLFARRCREFAAKPPSDDWTGTVVMREK